MTRKRSIYLATVVALLALITAAIFIGSEPTYQGKSLSYWLRCYSDQSYYSLQVQAARQATNGGSVQFSLPDFSGPDYSTIDAALSQLGTKSIPALLRLLSARNTPFKLKVAAYAEKAPLIHYTYWDAALRNRAGRHGFEVLGSAASNAVPDLIKILERRISETSEAATAWSLGMIGPAARAAVPVLLRRLPDSKTTVRDAIIGALTGIHTDPELVLPALVKELDNPLQVLPSRVFAAVAAYGPEANAAVPGLLSRINSKNVDARSCVVLSLRRIHPPLEAVRMPLQNALSDADPRICRDAAETLGDYGVEARATVPSLLGVINNPDESVRDSAVFSLGKIHASPDLCVPALIAALADDDRDVRRHAADSLGAYGADAKAATSALLKMLDNTDEDKYGRRCAEIALKRIDPEALTQAVKDGRVKLP